MGKRDTQLRKTLEHAAENHRTNRKRRVSRHAHQPRQPVFWHPLFAHHVPRMDENCSAQVLCCFPNGVQRAVIEVATIEPLAMIVRIDMSPNLDSAQPKIANATRQFFRSKIAILQRNGTKPDKARRISSYDF